jgi:hypothetical protein
VARPYTTSAGQARSGSRGAHLDRACIGAREGLHAGGTGRFGWTLGRGASKGIRDRRTVESPRFHRAHSRWLPKTVLRRSRRISREPGALLPASAMRRAGLARVRNVVWSCQPCPRSPPSFGSHALALSHPSDRARAPHVPRYVSRSAQDGRSAEDPAGDGAGPDRPSGSAAAPVLRAHGPLARPRRNSSAAPIPPLRPGRLRRWAPVSASARGLGVVPAERRPSIGGAFCWSITRPRPRAPTGSCVRTGPCRTPRPRRSAPASRRRSPRRPPRRLRGRDRRSSPPA